MAWKQSSLKSAFKLRSLSATGLIFRYQRYWLRLFGFAPFDLSPEASVGPLITKNYILSILAFALMIGSFLTFLMNTSSLVKTSFLAKSPKANPIVQAISYLPYSLTNLRAAIPLFMLICTRQSYPKLRNAADDIIFLCFPDPILRKRCVDHWRRVALGLGVFTLCSSLLWETLSWFDWFEKNPGYFLPEHTVSWFPFPVNIPSGPTIAFWGICQGLVFYLSQQVYIIAIVYGSVLTKCLRTIRESVGDMLRHVSHADSMGIRVDFDPLSDRVRNFRTLHAKTFDFSEKLNGCFGWMLFFFYGLDVITLCGFVAGMMCNETGQVYGYTFTACGMGVFFVYSTVFLMPFVKVYEEGQRVNDELVKLHSAVQQQTSAESKSLEKMVKALVLTRKDQTLGLNAGGLFYISRHLLGATCTFVVSSALMCYELLQSFEHRITIQSPDCNCRNVTGLHSQ